MTEKIRILIADDHKMVREGLKTFILPISDFEVVAEASNGREAVEKAGLLQPDVILMDLIMPEMDGIEVTQALAQQKNAARVLIVTSFAEDEKVIAAIQAGARGYMLKDSTPQELENAIRQIAHGENFLPQGIAQKIFRALQKPHKTQQATDSLTRREIEILQLIADGLSNDEISEKLVLSPWTVRSHLGRILKKLQVENRTQAAMAALRNGIVKIHQ